MMTFYAGKDYSDICEKCQTAVDGCVEEIEQRIAWGNEDMVSGRVLLAFDDKEAPHMLAYDRGLLCDNGICKGEEILFATPSMA